MKIFWLDTETTGTDPRRHSIVQLAYIIEINGQVKHKESLLASPQPGCYVDDRALEVHGRTRDEILSYPPPEQMFKNLTSTMKKFVNPYDREDKFFLAGYFVKFDYEMLRKFFWRQGNRYFGSWFYPVLLEVSTLVVLEVLKSGRAGMENFKLSTICDFYKIELTDAHDAASDIEATRKLFLELSKRL